MSAALDVSAFKAKAESEDLVKFKERLAARLKADGRASFVTKYGLSPKVKKVPVVVETTHPFQFRLSVPVTDLDGKTEDEQKQVLLDALNASGRLSLPGLGTFTFPKEAIASMAVAETGFDSAEWRSSWDSTYPNTVSTEVTSDGDAKVHWVTIDTWEAKKAASQIARAACGWGISPSDERSLTEDAVPGTAERCEKCVALHEEGENPYAV